LWSEQRTIMRRSYLNAHNHTVGIGAWTHEDDAFMDLIDIRLALLFDRCGKLEATKDIIGDDDKRIEQDIHDKEDTMKAKPSAAMQLLAKFGQNEQANNTLGSAPTW